MEEIKCSLCLEEKKLMKSHAIPAVFFKQIRSNPKKSLIVKTNKNGVFPKRAPIGVYEKLLCDDCEGICGIYDSYAKTILIDGKYKIKEKLQQEGVDEGIIVENMDYTKLKLFFLSVLWRASVMKNIFYAKVDCGPYNETLREKVLNKDPGDKYEFACLVARFDNQLAKVALLHPIRVHFDKVNFYQIYMSDYIVYIQVDKQPVPPSLAPLVLCENGQMPIIYRSFKESDELRKIALLI